MSEGVINIIPLNLILLTYLQISLEQFLIWNCFLNILRPNQMEKQFTSYLQSLLQMDITPFKALAKILKLLKRMAWIGLVLILTTISMALMMAVAVVAVIIATSI